MTTNLAPALAEFTLPDKTAFSVDICEGELRLTSIDQRFPNRGVGENELGRWKAVAEYVTELSGQPCSTTQAIWFYKAIFAASEKLFTEDQKKTTTPPASSASSDATPAACENAGVT